MEDPTEEDMEDPTEEDITLPKKPSKSKTLLKTCLSQKRQN